MRGGGGSKGVILRDAIGRLVRVVNVNPWVSGNFEQTAPGISTNPRKARPYHE
jgi:hypothetical protein